MILQFVIAALLLLVFFGIAMVIPFIRAKSTKSIDQERRNQLNHELYDIRVKEVEEDIDQGVVIDKETMIAELQYNLLDDINENEQAKVNNSQWIWIPGLVFLVIVSVGLYWSVGAYKEVNDWQGALQRYPDIHKKLFEEPDARPSEKELNDLMLGLRTHLANQPSDAQGWVLYSRLGRVFQDKELALDAIKKAVQGAPDDQAIQLEYIELKMKIGDEYSQSVAPVMLAKFIQKHPENYDAWSMYGFMALQQGDFAAAIYRWQKMLALVGANSDKTAMLNSSIAYAKEQLALQKKAQSEQVNTVEKTAEPENAVAVDGPAYHVNITLSNDVNYTKNATLFVYAQSAGGPAMPIAAIKLPITGFPTSVVLSDANAMMQGVKLSDHKQFLIKARIAEDGTANSSAGQWFGQSDVIDAGEAAAINIEINQKS
ncbi:c-type cytochrome biogenesis protein CcmI [Psychromonas sp. RZ22]|uniref:c-type cytochrome biogenesis protein CcmI n=1 Tax=Psychromonas algarum TaxID=2555643 RepID=UPI0010688C5C|nr:c-type cytochrome biogenesis protein CcmI [Psychromonas sp. RZ22]TEW56716.1 c-type cytochrome biogenesis protein CcmI [Psychromonas sp. RZ22]